MSRHTWPYKGASVEARAEGEIIAPAPAATGARIVVTLWQDYASAGYKTDYQRVAKRWLTCEVRDASGKLVNRYCWAFSGSRFARGREQFDGMIQGSRERGEIRFEAEAAGVSS